MKVAGINTVEAIFNNVKGDMSKVVNVLVPSMAELYENIDILNQEKEDAPSAEELANYESSIDSIFS